MGFIWGTGFMEFMGFRVMWFSCLVGFYRFSWPCRVCRA